MSNQQPPSQPEDFPNLDLEAWRAALPMPVEPEPDGLDDMITFALASAEATPPAPEPKPEPPLVLGSDVFARKARRFRRQP